MRIVKTLELNEDQMHLLILNGMGMTKQEICDATGRGESDVAASIADVLAGWKTEIIASNDGAPALPVTPPPVCLPETRTLAELKDEWGGAVPADAKMVDNRELLKGWYPGRRTYTKKAAGIPVTDDQYQIWKMVNGGHSISSTAKQMGKSCANIMASISRMEKRGLTFNIMKGRSDTARVHRRTKEGIAISELEHKFAQLYARGEHNLSQMAESLGVKLQAIHDVKYRLKNKLAIRDDIEFNYALRAIAEL